MKIFVKAFFMKTLSELLGTLTEKSGFIFPHEGRPPEVLPRDLLNSVRHLIKYIHDDDATLLLTQFFHDQAEGKSLDEKMSLLNAMIDDLSSNRRIPSEFVDCFRNYRTELLCSAQGQEQAPTNDANF